jgi:hypothetical protein
VNCYCGWEIQEECGIQFGCSHELFAGNPAGEYSYGVAASLVLLLLSVMESNLVVLVQPPKGAALERG